VIPNVAAQTAGDRRQILLTLTIAFGIAYLAKISDVAASQGVKKLLTGKGDDRSPAIRALEAQNAVGWVILIVILSIGSDFETSRPLAVAFAWLILIASVLQNGEKAIKTLSALQGKGSK
jgi:hypothetical protein